MRFLTKTTISTSENASYGRVSGLVLVAAVAYVLSSANLAKTSLLIDAALPDQKYPSGQCHPKAGHCLDKVSFKHWLHILNIEWSQ